MSPIISQSAGQGGGSQPGISVVDYLFTEVATAGVYTAPTLVLPADSFLVDVQWWLRSDAEADWAATTAVLDVVDTAIGVLLSEVDVKGSAYTVVSAADVAELSHPYVFPNIAANTAEPAGGGTLTTTITTTVTSPPVVPKAVMIVRMIYIASPTPAPAVFA